MPRSPQGRPASEYVYRRVSPREWDDYLDQPGDGFFRLRQKIPGVYERGVSVYRADLCSPRKVLNLLLKQQSKKAAWLAENGSTPEELLEKGWHIVRMYGDTIAQLGFELEPPSKSGHLNVVGSKEDFEQSAFDLIELADDVPKAECLA